MLVSPIKAQNLENAHKLVKKAAQNGANVVVLPECFNSPYGTEFFLEYAEQMGGKTCTALSEMAKLNSVYLVGGSFP